METEVDLRLVALFGSETRLRALAVLAGARRPLTSYRIGKTAEIPLPKAYREMARLEKTRLVGRSGVGWVLLDEDVRRLLRKRVRISWADDFFSEQARRGSTEAALLKRLRRSPSARPPKGWQPKDPERFVRSPLKDRILREMGLRTSVHAD